MTEYVITDLNPTPTSKSDCVLGDLDAITASLYNLLVTIPGTDLFRPTRGLNAMAWLFTPFTISSKVFYENSINNQVKAWEPRVQQVSSNITFDSLNRVMTISIAYVTTINGLTSPSLFSVNLTQE